MTSPIQGSRSIYPGHLETGKFPDSSLNPGHSSLSSSPVPTDNPSPSSPTITLTPEQNVKIEDFTFSYGELLRLVGKQGNSRSSSNRGSIEILSRKSSDSEFRDGETSTSYSMSEGITPSSTYFGDEEVNNELEGPNPNQGLRFITDCFKETLANLHLFTPQTLDLKWTKAELWSGLIKCPTGIFDECIEATSTSNIASFKARVKDLNKGEITSKQIGRISHLFEIYYSQLKEKRLLEHVRNSFSDQKNTSLIEADLDWVESPCLQNLSDECQTELRGWIRSTDTSKFFESFTQNDTKNVEQIKKINKFFSLCKSLDVPQCKFPASVVSCLFQDQIVFPSLAIDIENEADFEKLLEKMSGLAVENKERIIELSFSSTKRTVMPKELFHSLSGLPNLNKLSANEFVCTEGFQEASLKNLKSADLRFFSSVESPGKLLKFLPNIETLSLRLNENLPLEDLRAFCTHESLKTLSFFQCTQPSQGFFTIPFGPLNNDKLQKGSLKEINLSANDVMPSDNNRKSLSVMLTPKLFLSSHLFAKDQEVVIHIHELGSNTNMANFVSMAEGVNAKIQDVDLSAKSVDAKRSLTFINSEILADSKESPKVSKKHVMPIKV